MRDPVVYIGTKLHQLLISFLVFAQTEREREKERRTTAGVASDRH